MGLLDRRRAPAAPRTPVRRTVRKTSSSPAWSPRSPLNRSSTAAAGNSATESTTVSRAAAAFQAKLKEQGIRRPRTPKVIKFGSDFSGIDAAATALKRMSLQYVVEFVSDTDPVCQNILKEVHAPKKVWGDVLGISPKDKPYVDVYVFTPPCQDFSSNGKMAGSAGPRRTGVLCARALKYVRQKQPRVCIFENVPTLAAEKFKPFLDGMCKFIKESGYNVHYKVMDSRNYGLPHARRRIFVVGIRKDCVTRGCTAFEWPKPLKTPSINVILDKLGPKDLPGGLPKSKAQRDRAVDAYKKCFANGVDPRTTTVSVDVDCSKQFSSYGVDEMKTLTRNRGGAGGPWISTRGRRTTLGELLKAGWGLMWGTMARLAVGMDVLRLRIS